MAALLQLGTIRLFWNLDWLVRRIKLDVVFKIRLDMRTFRHLFATVGLLSLLCGGCGKQPVAHSVNPNLPVLKVTVLADGQLTVNGETSTIQALREALPSLREKHGVVWYYREGERQEALTTGSEVLLAVVDARTPIRLSNRPDYSDSIEHGGTMPDGAVVFLVADVALVPGEHWKEMWTGPIVHMTDTRPPVLKGEDEFNGVYIQVAADPADECSLDQRAAGLRKDYEVDPEIIPGSLKETKFKTDTGLAGIHFAFDKQRETEGKKAKSHQSIFIVRNADGVCVWLTVIASGVGHEPTDLGSTDQMIQKTLRLKKKGEAEF